MADLKTLIAKRDSLVQRLSRLQGKHEAANQSQAEIDQECRKHGFEASRLPEVIETLKAKHEQMLDEFSQGLRSLEEKVSQYEESVNGN